MKKTRLANSGYYNAERDTKRRVSRLRQVSAVYDYGFFPCMCTRARAPARARARARASQPAEIVGAPRVFALRGYAYEFFSKRRWRRRCMRAAENSSSRLVSSRPVSSRPVSSRASVRACVRACLRAYAFFVSLREMYVLCSFRAASHTYRVAPRYFPPLIQSLSSCYFFSLKHLCECAFSI